MKPLLLFIIGVLYSCLGFSQADTSQKIVQGRTNSPEQQQKPYVIMISADGFRNDYAQKYGATTLLTLSHQAVQAEGMIPSYPSLTFPNHYTLVTGLYPSHHGLASNYFYDVNRRAGYGMRDQKAVKDGSWYGGTPLWVLAEKQQMLTASYFWVGSEADIQKTLPSYYYNFNETTPMDHRIKVVVDWLQLPAEKRPHLITFYISNVDHEGHAHGPDAPETGAAVRFVDSTIQKLTEAVGKTGLPVNYIFVSDHGMTNVDTVKSLRLPAVIDTSKFIIPRGSELVELYAKNKADISETYNKLKAQEDGYKVYLRKDMPANLHYGESDDIMGRIGDILLIPNWPLTFWWGSRKPNPGGHGYDPHLVKDMTATFLAWGPAFKNHMHIPAFENVHVYPIVAKILGLKYSEVIDGDTKIADMILK
jgi:predicted AlkP superfamily pyrophosphatase or phosphodiesterase